MAQLVTLQQLMARVRSRADSPVGGNTDDDELVDFINESARRLYAGRVKADRDSFIKRATLVLAPDNVALPSDLLKLVTVEAQLGNGSFMRVPRTNVQDAPQPNNALCARQTYELEGSNPGVLWCQPNPPPYATLRIRYVPDTWGVSAAGSIPINALSDPDDHIEVGMGWDRLIILDAAIAVVIKEESDPRPLQAERAKVEAEVMSEADDRDSNEPRTAVDVREW